MGAAALCRPAPVGRRGGRPRAQLGVLSVEPGPPSCSRAAARNEDAGGLGVPWRRSRCRKDRDGVFLCVCVCLFFYKGGP